MATYDPAVMTALQQALPGYNVTEDDATWWTNQGGVSAVQQQWSDRFPQAAAPASPLLSLLGRTPTSAPAAPIATPAPPPVATPAPTQPLVNQYVVTSDGQKIPAAQWETQYPGQVVATFPEFTPAYYAKQEEEKLQRIRDELGALKTPEELSNFFVRRPYTPEEISKAMPQYAAADLEKEMRKAWHQYVGASPNLTQEQRDFLDSRYQFGPGRTAGMLLGSGPQAYGAYRDPALAQKLLDEHKAYLRDPGPTTVGGYHGYAGQQGQQPTGGITTLPAGSAERTTQAGATSAAQQAGIPSLTGFTDVLKKPDVSYAEVRKYYDDLIKDPKLTPAQKAELEKIGGKFTELENTWGRYGTDPYQTETIYRQIVGVNEKLGGKNWQGSWMSGGDNAAREAAVRLQKMGVDNLADLKVVMPDARLPAVELYQGQEVQTDDKGKKYIGGGVIDEFGMTSPKTYLPSDAKTQIAYANVGIDAEGNSQTVDYIPLTEEESKTYDPKTGTYATKGMPRLIDASSGKVIAQYGGGLNNVMSLVRRREYGKSEPNEYDFTIDYYDTGNFVKGKDKKFGIKVTKDGVPVPYISTEKTGLVTTPIFPILLSLVGGPWLSSALASTGASALATGTIGNAIATQGIMGGINAGIQGGDIGKGILSGALGAGVTGGIADLIPAGSMDPALANAISRTGGNVVSTAIRGGDIGEALLGGAINYGMGAAGSSLGLTPQQVNFGSGIVAPLLRGQKINPVSLAMSMARNAATPYSR